MNIDADIKQMMHSQLDPIEVSAEVPQHVVHRGRKRRRMKSVGVGLASGIILGLISLNAVELRESIRIQPADHAPAPFVELPVRNSVLDGDTPIAPPQFPDCTRDTVEVQSETEAGFVTVEVRARRGVQCGLQPWPNGFWTDATGDVFEPKRQAPFEADRFDRKPEVEPGDPQLADHSRILLMGSSRARHSARTRVCGVPPLTYSITFVGDPFEIATVDDPICRGEASGGALEKKYSFESYQLETPMAFLDPQIEVLESETPAMLSFMLTLVNDTDEAISTGRCPFYDVTYKTSDRQSRLRSYLNCPAAPDEVRPGQTIGFRIELGVKGATSPGALKVTLRDQRRILHELETEVPPL